MESTRILFEDNHLLIIDKLPGEITQKDKTSDLTILDWAKNYLKVKYSKKGEVYIGLPHRIDRPTSGILVLARTSKALTRLSDLFKSRDIEKIYWVLLEKNKKISKEGLLRNWMTKNQNLNKTFVVQENKPTAKLAELSYKILKELANYYWVEVKLLTGRHHQIRAQFAYLGCPVQGDIKYGAKRSNADGSIGLHAYAISFTHPVTRQLLQVQSKPKNFGIWSIIYSQK